MKINICMSIKIDEPKEGSPEVEDIKYYDITNIIKTMKDLFEKSSIIESLNKKGNEGGKTNE